MNALNNHSDPQVLAYKTTQHLSHVIKGFKDLSEAIMLDKVNVSTSNVINFYSWLYVLDFMRSKITSAFLGYEDEYFEIHDLKFNFIYKKEYSHEL